MKNIKIKVGVHVMPWEVGDFRNQVRNHALLLSNTVNKSDLESITFIPTLNLNDDIIDWENSKIDKDYYIDHFNISCDILSKVVRVKKIIGGVESTSDNLKNIIENLLCKSDFYIWTDPDIFFNNSYWAFVFNSIKSILSTGTDWEYYILTPSTTKMWDSTWDVIVDSTEKDYGYSHRRFNNSNYFDYYSTVHKNNVTLKYTDYVKLGGGLGNVFSPGLLNFIGVPDYYKGYGGVDTYIASAAHKLKCLSKLEQYKMENNITVQDIVNSDKEWYKRMTPPKITKEDQRKKSEGVDGAFFKALGEFDKKLKNIGYIL